MKENRYLPNLNNQSFENERNQISFNKIIPNLTKAEKERDTRNQSLKRKEEKIKKNPIIRLNTQQEPEDLLYNDLEYIDDFDAPENADYVEITIEQVKCGDKVFIRQLKNYYAADGTSSHIVKIDGLEKC